MFGGVNTSVSVRDTNRQPGVEIVNRALTSIPTASGVVQEIAAKFFHSGEKSRGVPGEFCTSG